MTWQKICVILRHMRLRKEGRKKNGKKENFLDRCQKMTNEFCTPTWICPFFPNCFNLADILLIRQLFVMQQIRTFKYEQLQNVEKKSGPYLYLLEANHAITFVMSRFKYC